MCKCTPEIKTPFFGGPGCEWPKPVSPQNFEGPVPDPKAQQMMTDVCAEIAQMHYEGKITAIAVAMVMPDGDVRTLFAFQKGTRLSMCAGVHLLDSDIAAQLRQRDDG